MAYDFQQAVAAATAVVNRTSNNEDGAYKYPLVYPAAGNTYQLRLLFNPPSGQIVRLINRHEKVPCYKTYGQDCPICKVMQDVKNLTATDPFGRTKASKSRGIAFAQYISSAQPHKNGEKVIQPGEIVLLMFPWSVYTQINALIQAVAQTPTGMDQAFCHADSGLFIQISASTDFKYTTTSVPYMMYPTGKTDEEFLSMLESMESLNDQVIPSTITDEVSKQVSEYAEAINRQYIVPRTPTQVPQSAPAPMGQMYTAPVQQTPVVTPVVCAQSVVSPAPTQVPQSAPTPIPAPMGNPACYGKHNPGSTQCICCPVEVQCMSST